MRHATARRLSVLALALGSLVSPTGIALAQDATLSEFRSLADRARTDPEALQQLRRIDEVEGRDVDLDAALGDAEGDELDARLKALAEDDGIERNEADARKDAARSILSDRRYEAPKIPRPFRGASRRTGDWFAPVGRFVDRVIDLFPGGPIVFWLVVAAAVIALSVLAATRLARRGVGVEPAEAGAISAADDPAALERSAEDAHGRGDHATAVRLLFRAGLLRLDRTGVLRLSASLTSGQIDRILKSKSFSSVASAFDQIVYGGRRAEPSDVAAARSGWAQIFREVAPG